MNKIMVIGNITKDAVIRENNGRKAINFAVAVNENYKNKDGQKVEKATFYSCTRWVEAMGSVEISKYLLKGKKVLVEGAPSAEMYKNKDNETAVDFRINVKYVELLSPADKKEGEDHGETNGTVAPVTAGEEDSPF